jgi:pimeloyl-ACP methyl ester carboxylesterase
MPTYTRGDVSIYYEELGQPTGFPLLLLAPGGLNSTIDFWTRMPINPLELFAAEYRVIGLDQRNAGRRSTGPIPTVDPWDAYAADQLGLLDHLGVARALTIGCCIGSSFILKLIATAPDRVVAGILMQPIGTDETNPEIFGPRMYTAWGEELATSRPDVTAADVQAFGAALFPADFVHSVSREFVATVQTPLLVMPGNDPAHPHGVGMEVFDLLPNAELLDNWKAPADVIPATVERMRAFLHAHTPTSAA